MAKRKPRRRSIQPAEPPRIPMTVLLTEPTAHGVIAIAASEGWAISKVLAEIIEDWFHGGSAATHTLQRRRRSDRR